MAPKAKAKPKNTKPKVNRKPRSTKVYEGIDLRSTLKELSAPKNAKALSVLSAVLGNIRKEFDPASVTMTSTTIPDAINKLTSALTESSKASHNVFDIIDRLTAMSDELNLLVNNFCQEALTNPPDRNRLESFRGDHNRRQQEIKAIAHEVVIAQSFQDLCGQNITKVLKLIRELDVELRALFKQVKTPLPNSSNGIAESEIDQAFADSLFEST
jgi:chemotaxis regulatin CheY-phosphate phosphatase CheZ